MSSAERTARAWEVLAGVPDPEIPTVSICDLGIVRAVRDTGAGIEVALTPTYSGCPATEAIQDDVRGALEAAGLGPVTIKLQRAPAWSSDWISEEGKRKLRECGIAPPARSGARHPACPRCGGAHTELLSAFGSTACKALHRCLDCREPFEYFKPV